MTQKPPVTFPKNVVGYTSPYPTVVIVTMAHQKECGILSNPESMEEKQ